MTDEEKWKAVVENDESMDGVFFYCVKSTGIFCRPSCNSRVPRREHVFFVDTKEEALEVGFRPCKRCRSDLVSYKPLDEVAGDLKHLMDGHWKDSLQMKQAVRELGFSEHRLAEIFKQTYGKTPAEYVADKKLVYAQEQLLHSDMRIVDIAYDLGFAGLSSFYKFFRERIGTAPAEYRRRGREE